MQFLFALLDSPTPEQLERVIPVAGMMMVLGIVIVVALAIAYVKIRHKEAERDMFARRLAYEQRMKELEVEALRLRSGGSVENAGSPR
jgi:heme/copper-type cytochrome/quinol oxidase subunit 2